MGLGKYAYKDYKRDKSNNFKLLLIYTMGVILITYMFGSVALFWSNLEGINIFKNYGKNFMLLKEAIDTGVMNKVTENFIITSIFPFVLGMVLGVKMYFTEKKALTIKYRRSESNW